MAGFTNNHRYFIQYMLKNGVRTVENAQEYCKHISKGEIENLTQFKTLVIEINREISKQNYKLVFIICEVTNRHLLVWLNTKNDDISRLQLKHSALELEYFHTILQEILHSEEHRLTFIVCINITSTLTSFFSRENGEKMLKELINKGYFIGEGGYIYFGSRLILEFTSYLKTHLPEAVCNLCSELVFWGKVCDSCQKMLHKHCLKKYLENQNNCPTCHATWTSPIDEEVVGGIMEIDQNSPESSERTATKKSLHTKRTFSNYHDSSTDEENDNRPGPSSRKHR